MLGGTLKNWEWPGDKDNSLCKLVYRMPDKQNNFEYNTILYSISKDISKGGRNKTYLTRSSILVISEGDLMLNILR